ncbi:hypothetical protein EZS27_010843 [termite gut metagenome]|uniref:Uncharacterized protein n=1 Tax=termite gut metagenome TaxID=433724 RepID=A0A5J4S7G8_9ZZZZ
MSEQGQIDLFYGDESHVCSEGYVPYGWQFPDEEVALLVCVLYVYIFRQTF